MVILAPKYDENGLPDITSLKENINKVNKLCREGKVYAAYTPTYGGVAEAICKMAIGNGYGFKFEDSLTLEDIFGYKYGSFILETNEDIGIKLGEITEDAKFVYQDKVVSLDEFNNKYENKMESVYPCLEGKDYKKYENFSYERKEILKCNFQTAKPKVLIPVFPGTNCEFDTAKALRDAGAEANIFVINNLTADNIARSVEDFAKEITTSQMIFIPGGFSGGDEPDGSGKFIMAFFRNEAIKEEVDKLLYKRDGLMAGICNGFQALIKLGLVPYGKIIDADENNPTLTFNTISRHQSKLVRLRVASNKSPWLKATEVGDIYTVAISHGEGRFMASDEVVKELAKNGQIATQYVDLSGNATEDIRYNPNGSTYAIEGITSPDGRVFGKMGHSERIGEGLYKNVPGEFDMKMFKSAVEYFK